MTKVCHMTSAHEATDDRIFLKECKTLKKTGYDVFIVAQGESFETEGIHIIGAGEKPLGRIKRMTSFAKHVYKIASSLDCDIYHFHDPELLSYGVKLAKAGKKVIFDSHEDVPATIMDREWIPNIFRKIISKTYKVLETKSVKNFSCVISATKHIEEQFVNRARLTETICNYPMLDDIVFHDTAFAERSKQVCYVGGLSPIRGEKQILDSMKSVSGKLVIAGPWDIDTDTLDENIEYLGKVSRKKVNEIYGDSRVGLLLYQPAENHYESQPIKMFEYMAAGIPLVACDYPLWVEIIEKNNCGICVPPTDTAEISKAVNYLLDNCEEAEAMGRNGYEAVKRKYDWAAEGKKLVDLYCKIQK